MTLIDPLHYSKDLVEISTLTCEEVIYLIQTESIGVEELTEWRSSVWDDGYSAGCNTGYSEMS